LKKLGEFEKRIGIEFTHCGLLSKALSHSHPTDPAFELTFFFFLITYKFNDLIQPK